MVTSQRPIRPFTQVLRNDFLTEVDRSLAGADAEPGTPVPG